MDDPQTQTKRLLSIYDFGVQPYSIGDFVFFLVGALEKAETLQLDKIDFCLLCDESHPPLEATFVNLVSEGRQISCIMRLLPLLQLNPRLGSFHLLRSYAELQTFLTAHIDEYCLWPSMEKIAERKYVYYEIFVDLKAFFKWEGRVPCLRPSTASQEWCDWLLSHKVNPRVPVTINLRNNPYFHFERNSNIDAWLGLFDYCREIYPVTFLVICGVSEIDERLRERPNVVVVKDFNTDAEQDISLMFSSAFHLGASSGPATALMMSKIPYVFYNMGVLEHLHAYQGAVVQERGGYIRTCFAAPYQRFTLFKETTKNLIAEFENIWISRNWEAWSKEKFEQCRAAENCPVWLR